MDAKRKSVKDNPRQCAPEGAQTGHLNESATLQDLLDATMALEPGKRILKDMLRRTSKHRSNCLGKLPSDIQVSQLIEVAQPLRTFLVGKLDGPVILRRYSNCVRAVIETAEELGWIADNGGLRRKWREILKCLPKKRGGLWVTDWATRRGIDPDHFGAAELKLCAREAIQQGRSYLSVRRVESYLPRLVVQEKLGSRALGPSLCRNVHSTEFRFRKWLSPCALKSSNS